MCAKPQSARTGPWLKLVLLSISLVALALPGSAGAEAGHYLSFAKSSSMNANTTNVVNGQARPGTLLLLNGQPIIVRSLSLGEIRAGETLKALSEVEVTNDLVTKDGQGTNQYHDVMGGLTLVIADSPTATTGIEVAEAQASTVTPEVHHWTFEKSGTFTAAENLSDRYLNLVMWAQSPEALTECWTFPRSSLPSPQEPRACGLDVDYNRGHLSVLRSGPPSASPSDATPFSSAQFSGQSLPEAAPSDAPITYSGEAAQFIVALSRPVGTLKTGDVLTAHSELEVDARNAVRSNQYCNVGVATRLYLSPNPSSLSGARAIGNEAGNNLTGRNGRQIKSLERGVVPSSTTFKLDRDYTTPMYVLLRAWMIGSSACAVYGNGIRAQLDQPASFMHVMRYRPEQRADLVNETLNTGDDSERASQLDLATSAPVSLFSQRLQDLAPGDLIEALAEFEVDSQFQRAEVHSTFVLADAPDATTGTPLQVNNFTEVSPFMGSLPIHDATGWVVPPDISGTKYLNLVAYATGLQTLGTPLDSTIAIPPDDGRMVVNRIRPRLPEPPAVVDTDRDSPANDNNPEVKGSAEAGSTVRLYESASCGGAVEAVGTASSFSSPGLTAAVTNNVATSFTATATDAAGHISRCSTPFGYIEDSLAPPAPTITDTDPNSPANDNYPEVKGSAEANSTVRLYTTSGCTGSFVTGTASLFASPGLTASVANNTTTKFRATATDRAGNRSACGKAFSYTERTPTG